MQDLLASVQVYHRPAQGGRPAGHTGDMLMLGASLGLQVPEQPGWSRPAGPGLQEELLQALWGLG